MALENLNIKDSVKESSDKVTTEVKSFAETEKEDLEQKYIDKRSVTISLVHNYSNYRRVNMKVLGQRRETIGSSVRSCQILCSNADEVAAYFPAIIGISPNHPDFVTRVKSWLSNIQFNINENDVKLNTTFIYDHKKDYLRIKEQEDRINDEYDKVDRANISAIREALKHKIDALNTLESTKYQYGHPENIEQYLMYRHCLLYRDVAKDTALINSDTSIRFYIKDENKEAEKQKRLVHEKSTAMRNFVELNGSEQKLNAAYIAITLAKNESLAEALLKDKSTKLTIIMDFVNNYPDKFNKIFNDKQLMIKAFIETLIIRGELVRGEYNQRITSADGTFIGANINEAIAWFEDPNNKAAREVFEKKVKVL